MRSACTLSTKAWPPGAVCPPKRDSARGLVTPSYSSHIASSITSDNQYHQIALFSGEGQDLAPGPRRFRL
jgi:hypothetical protein